MRNKIFALLFAVPAFSFSQQQQFTIKGTADSLNNTHIYLDYRKGHDHVMDSALVTNGHFEFKGNIGFPVQAFIKIKNNTGFHDLYLEKGIITVQIPGHDIAKAVVSGTPVNEDNKLFIGATKMASNKYTALIKRRNEASDDERKSITFNHEIDSLLEACNQESIQARVGFIKEHPHSALSMIQLNSMTYFKISGEELSSLYNLLDPDLQKSDVGQELTKKLAEMKELHVGAVAPDFTLPDVNGKRISLSSFKGKYVLIDFWASWCMPCREENPNIARAYQQYKDKNFIVLGISLDNNAGKAQWVKAIENDKITWIQISDLNGFKNEAALLYHVSSIPQNFLVGPDGRILDQNLKGIDLQNKLKQLFN